MRRRTRISPACGVAPEETTMKEEENFVAQTGAVVVLTDEKPARLPARISLFLSVCAALR